jgi:hypothetical protein
MPVRSRLRRSLRAAWLLAAAATALAPGAADAAVDPGAVRAYAHSAAAAWTVHQQADGELRDPLQPASRGISYGTVMLADTMLSAAAGRGDEALAGAAGSLIRVSISHGVPRDPFNLLAAGALMHKGDAAFGTLASWSGLGGELRDWARSISAYPWQGSDGHCFTTPGCYSNWQLVWSAGAADLLRAGLDGVPGSLAADSARVQQEIRTTINRLAVDAAGPPVRVPGGTGRVLSDPPQNPLAYHIFSTYMLERVHGALPATFEPAALRLRAEAGRFAIAQMAPDGDLAYAGRSDEESWVLAAAAALGARRAAEGGPDAPRWRTFADRALARLWREHPLLRDGTIPIVPGLHSRWEAGMLDPYAQMAQYNGLTLWLLDDAAAHWPGADAPRAPLPADRELLVSDLGGTGLVWGRHGGMWWAVSGRRTAADPRYQQGVVAVKAITPTGTRDLLAARPRDGRPSSAWLLTARSREARFVARSVSGTSRRATLQGDWRLQSGRTLRRASWTISAGGGRLVATTAVRRRERLTAAVWTRSGARALGRGGGAVRCRMSASDFACPSLTAWHGPRRAALAIAR